MGQFVILMHRDRDNQRGSLEVSPMQIHLTDSLYPLANTPLHSFKKHVQSLALSPNILFLHYANRRKRDRGEVIRTLEFQ